MERSAPTIIEKYLLVFIILCMVGIFIVVSKRGEKEITAPAENQPPPEEFQLPPEEIIEDAFVQPLEQVPTIDSREMVQVTKVDIKFVNRSSFRTKKAKIKIVPRPIMPQMHDSFVDNVQKWIDEIYAPYLKVVYKDILKQPAAINYIHSTHIDLILIIDNKGRVVNHHLGDFPSNEKLTTLKRILNKEVSTWIFKEVNQYGRCRVKLILKP